MHEHQDSWHDYLPGPKDDLLALGVVSLNYGYLENIFRIIFAFVTQLSEAQVRAIFERLNNKARQDVLDQLLGARPIPPELKDLVRHFLDGFVICADNRHAIMHSHHGGLHLGERGTGGIVLRKISRSGVASIFFAHTKALREVADAIDRQSAFGCEVLMAVDRFNNSQKPGRSPFELSSLPEKLPLPDTLNWQPAPGIPASRSPL
jgi:hypothetical protein